MKIKYSFFLLIISISCKPGHDEIYKFDPRNLVENEIKLSEIADEISYIPLDNIYPLGPIHSNFTFLENSIYFSVTYTGILEFSRNGKFIRKIGKIGRGPGEYTSYIHFSVDEEKGLIYVLDIHSKSSPIKVYSGAGYFQKGISLSESENSINTFEYYNSKFIVFNSLSYGDSKYNWIISDTLGNIIPFF
jgi:hypothetical protein